MLRRWFAFLAVAASLAVSGCAALKSEFDNRGGFSDYLLDQFWFKADTKKLRVLRSYVLVGSLARLASNRMNKRERTVMAAHVSAAVAAANDAFECAYILQFCSFFDDRMAELDKALLRIAILALDDADNEKLMKVVKARILEKTTAGQTINLVGKWIDASTATINTAAKLSSIASSLLEFSGSYVDQFHKLGALYRDAIELDMLVVLASLGRDCQTSGTPTPATPTTFTQWQAKWDANGQKPTQDQVCKTFDEAMKAYQGGSGSVTTWREYLKGLGQTNYLMRIVPEPIHFVQASDLIFRACEDISDLGGIHMVGALDPTTKPRKFTTSRTDAKLNRIDYKSLQACTGRLIHEEELIQWWNGEWPNAKKDPSLTSTHSEKTRKKLLGSQFQPDVARLRDDAHTR